MLSDDMTDQDRIDMLAAALADYRRAFANDGKTSSLADWQRRMKAADTSAAAVLLRCVGADPLAG